MSWFNQQIAKIFPTYALKREIALRRLRMLEKFKSEKRTFEAVAKGRGRYDLLSTARSPDAAIKGDIAALREHVRQSEYNEGFVRGPIRRIVRESVGRGIRYQARLRADNNGYNFPKFTQEYATEWNYQAEKGFKTWNKQADKRLISTFYELQALADASLIRDGEVIAVGRISTKRSRLIPYCIELMEADRLATPVEEITNPQIRNGIRYDEEGSPSAYFIYKHHPGEGYMVGMRGQDFEEIPAYFPNGLKKVMHIFSPMRPEQSRGFSEFGPGLKDLQDLERYMEAEKMAALEAACLTGIVTTENPKGFQQAFTESSGSPDYERINEFGPGLWHYMRNGEKVDIFNPSRPNESFGAFVDQLIRGPANALDVPPEVFSQNWKDFNYSNARTVLLQFYSSMIMRQFHLVNHLCQPILENVISWLVTKGLVNSDGFDRRRDDYFESAWIPSVYRKWVDPTKEASGKQIGLETLVESLTEIVAEQGKDFEEHIEQIAREKQKILEMEKQYGVTLTQPKKPASIVPKDEEEEQEAVKNLKIVKG